MTINKFISIFFLFFFISYANTLAKLGNIDIALKEFQEYVDIQKFIANKKSVDDLLSQQKIDKNTMLSRYLDQKILLLSAEEKDITTKHPLVNQKYEQTYLKWIGQIYTLKNVDLSNDKVSEADMEKVYNKYNQDKKPFSTLSNEEKSGLYRLALLEKLQASKNVYQKKLEKKYKVSRKKIDAEVIAVVNKEDITQKDLDLILQQQLASFGLSKEQAKERNPNQYEKILDEVREELIFNKLIEVDMKKSKFLSQSIVKKTLDTYRKQLTIEAFFNTEIIPSVKVSDSELDLAFQELSKVRPAIRQVVPTEQEKILKRFILQKKQPEILSNYLLEKKEEIIIKRNKNLLTQVT